MKKNILKAKIKRNKLIENAGIFFVDDTSQIIKQINKEGKNAILGIYDKEKKYTVIGLKKMFYLTKNGNKGEILHEELIDEFQKNGSRIGSGYFKFKFCYKNIVLSNGDKVWLKNSKTMFSLWNTILWFQKLNDTPAGGSIHGS